MDSICTKLLLLLTLKLNLLCKLCLLIVKLIKIVLLLLNKAAHSLNTLFYSWELFVFLATFINLQLSSKKLTRINLAIAGIFHPGFLNALKSHIEVTDIIPGRCKVSHLGIQRISHGCTKRKLRNVHTLLKGIPIYLKKLLTDILGEISTLQSCHIIIQCKGIIPISLTKCTLNTVLSILNTKDDITAAQTSIPRQIVITL